MSGCGLLRILLVLYFTTPAAVHAEDIGMGEKSFRLSCELALGKALPQIWKQRFNNVRPASSAFIAILRRSSESVEAFNSLPESTLGKQNWYYPMNSLPKDGNLTIDPARKVSFTVAKINAPQSEIFEAAAATGHVREYGRFIVYFENGDSFSSKIEFGEENALAALKEITLLKMLIKIDKGELKNSAGTVYKFQDVTTIELVHNHPYGTGVRAKIEGEDLWFGGSGYGGGLGFSHGDRGYFHKARLLLENHFQGSDSRRESLKQIKFRMTILGRSNLAAQFDLVELMAAAP